MKKNILTSVFMPTLFLLLFIATNMTFAEAGNPKNGVADFHLRVLGQNFGENNARFELFDLSDKQTSIEHSVKNKQGAEYRITFDYKSLPSNRSYPGNLNITLFDSQGEELGYLFFATNGIQSLRDIGVFGLRVNDDGEIIDVRIVFDEKRTGSLELTDLKDERFVQDTLIPSKGFQMIRPVLLQAEGNKLRKGFSLDSHPFEVTFSAQQAGDGVVEFQHNLFSDSSESETLLISAYYYADSLTTLRQGMFASKYFDPEYGVIKLVFYPALGQI